MNRLNRREFLLTGAALAATTAFPRPVRSVLGGREESEDIACPSEFGEYIRDGLVAMWDGEYNSLDEDGLPMHDDAPSMWADLSGNGYDLTLNGADTIGADFVSHATTWVARSYENLPFMSSHAVFRFSDERRQRVFCGRSALSEGNDYLYAQTYTSGKIGVSQRLAANRNLKYAEVDCSDLMGSVMSLSVNYAQGYYFGASSCYANGEEREILTGSAEYNNAGNNFVIGARCEGSALSMPTGATVYNIRLYGRSLSPFEIAWNYAIDKARFGI